MMNWLLMVPWRAALAATAWACLCLALVVMPAAAQTPQRLAAAVTTEASGNVFPINSPLTIVSLPDDWALTRPGRPGPVWYRFNLRPAGPPDTNDLTAIYIERVCSNLAVYLNGHLVHSAGHADDTPLQNCNLSQLITLPSALWLRQDNTIDIKVSGAMLATVGSSHRAGGISAVDIGPLSALAPRHARQTLVNVAAPQAVSATLVLMGGFMFVLGFFNRRESHLAYFGALSVGWAAVESRLWLGALPMSPPVVEFLLCTMTAFITLAAVQFLLRYAKWRHKWVDRILPLQCALMPASIVIAGTERLYPVASVWTAVFAIEVLAAAAFYLRRQWPVRTGSFWWMGSTLAVVAVAGLLELVSGPLGIAQLANLFAQIVTPVMFVLVGLRLVQQHGRALQQAEIGKARLEQRIREATAEIERNFNQLAELRVEQVTERERKRIAADLHDDLGAKLLTIVHTSDSERISTLAREALEEMRLSVRGLTGRPVRLADALGDWRAEVVSRLAQAGIEAEWTVPEDLPQTLSARAYVQTTRILREATSNIIKHSGASHCSIKCAIADGDFQLVIQDNGSGIRAEPEGGRTDRGHGMASMKQRAKQLQGQCLVESGPGYGTVIRLTLPLDRATEAA